MHLTQARSCRCPSLACAADHTVPQPHRCDVHLPPTRIRDDPIWVDWLHDRRLRCQCIQCICNTHCTVSDPASPSTKITCISSTTSAGPEFHVTFSTLRTLGCTFVELCATRGARVVFRYNSRSGYVPVDDQCHFDGPDEAMARGGRQPGESASTLGSRILVLVCT
jgi:hypothetical protein